jgi:peptidyl-dipeptidase Dcp
MQSENFKDMVNPILQYWQTPFETPPFHLIRTDHFEPAAKEAIKLGRKEIKAITENPDSPTFENTVAALDLTGENLGRVAAILFNLNSAETSSELQTVARKVSPMLTRFSNEITLNEKLFARIKEIHDSRSLALLSSEEQMLVERKFRNFLLGGAGLKDQKKNRFRKITLELARLSLRFEENVLRETNSFELHITDSSDLAGLPESIIEMASADAKQRKMDGWIFTLHYPSYMPFMQYSEKRHLREKLLKAYSSRSFNANKNDNRTLVRRIANLRLEIANLLGFRSFAEMTLGDRMAENPDRVESFINELYHESHPAALMDHQNL